MAENSDIGWTDHTFNPWIGCTRVSPACDNCYAEAWNDRFKGDRWGPKANRTRTSQRNWNAPVRWNRKAVAAGRRDRVFCASLADVFDNHRSIEPDWRADLWSMIRSTPSLDWLLLTKRPQNIAKMLPDDWRDGYPNVWLGTTVENQTEANRRIPHLLRIPAALHFLSCEPLLGPVALNDLVVDDGNPGKWHVNCLDNEGMHPDDDPDFQGRAIAWVIAGGESAWDLREVKADWLRALRDQCHAADVPFFFKQWHGRNQAHIKTLGRLLDGREHNAIPNRSEEGAL